MAALVLLGCSPVRIPAGPDAAPVRPDAAPPATDTDQVQPSLATAVDGNGGLWIVAGYTDLSDPAESSMGLSIRPPKGDWQSYPPLSPAAGASFRPSGDAWLAATQNGSRVYYVSLLTDSSYAGLSDDVADGLALAVVDVSSGTPVIEPPRRIDLQQWPLWDEPTVAATRPPGADVDTVIVAGTPLGDDLQDVVAVLVSNDGGATFHATQRIFAPGYPGHQSGPANTLVRPVLEQDPRPGQECHAYMAYGVYYATALTDTPKVAPPACETESSGCRSIAETETHDCGETWSDPIFVAVDTGLPGGEDYRGFSYAIAQDGTRFAFFGDEDIDNAPMLVKRAAPGSSFAVQDKLRGTTTWADVGTEMVVAGPSVSGAEVRRWRPTLAASATVAAVWVEEDATTHDTEVWYSTSEPAIPGSWTSAALIDTAGVACDGVAFPSDDYMGVTPKAPFSVPTSSFVLAWADFLPCDSTTTRHVRFTGFN